MKLPQYSLVLRDSMHNAECGGPAPCFHRILWLNMWKRRRGEYNCCVAKDSSYKGIINFTNTVNLKNIHISKYVYRSICICKNKISRT